MTTTTAYWARPGRPLLGQLLIAAGVLEEKQLQAALGEQRKWGDRLGRTLVHMGFISEDTLAEALSRQLQLPSCRPDREVLPADVTSHLGVLACERYGVMPLGGEGGVLRVATSDPSNAPLFDELAAIVGSRVEPVIATESAIGRAIRKHYYGEPIEPVGGAPDLPLDPRPVIDLTPIPEPTTGSVPVELTPIDPPAAPPAPPSAAADARLELDVEVTGGAELAIAQVRETVDRLEDDLAREVRALRGLVETLIRRGLITREEFLESVRGRPE